MKRTPVFDTHSGGMRTGCSGGIESGVSLATRSFMEKRGSPELPCHPLITRRSRSHRRGQALLALYGSHPVLSSWFVGHWTPGTINFTVPDYPRLALSPAYASTVPLPEYTARRPQDWLPAGGAGALAGQISHLLDDCFTFPKEASLTLSSLRTGIARPQPRLFFLLKSL